MIFHLGMNKTGTTSLHRLLKTLGVNSKHNVGWAYASREPSPDEDLVSLVSEFDAWTQDEHCNIERIERLFPGSQYIHLERPLRDWLYSMVKWAFTPTLNGPRGAARKYLALGDQTLHRQALLKHWVDKRAKRNAEIEAFFTRRPGQGLSVSLTTDPDWQTKVCEFLGHPTVVAPIHARPSRPTLCDPALQERLEEVDRVLDQL